ncbi:MFS transporter [Pigmentiphaga soli]|uniref:MFS transporter n=1 Tax=Pigmentiphaga soli TaxID=1007095 RepID=A0ABP8HB15_9BURK
MKSADTSVAAGNASSSPRAQSALSWDSFLATYLPALILALGAGIALPAIPTLAQSFGVGFGVASGVITSFLLGNLAGTLPSGWLIDRYGRRPVMIAGPALTAVTAILVVFTQSFTMLLVLRFFNGCAAQMWLMARLAAISQNAPPAQRGRLVSWMFGMDNTGKLGGPVLGGFIAAAWGPRAPFVAYAVLALLSLAPALAFSRGEAHEERPAPAKDAAAPTLTLRQIVMPRLPYFGVALFAGLTRGPLLADLLHLYAAFAYNLGPRAIGYLATAATALSWPIGFLAGWMMDRFGRKQTMVPGFTGVGISMAALAASAYLQWSLTWYVALFMLGVALQALTGGSIQTVGADVAPPEARGRFLGLWRFTGQGGATVSPILFAVLADHVDYGSAFLFVALSSVVVAYLLVRYIPETGRH